MPDRHVPSGFDHVGNVERGFFSRLVLVFNGLVLLILDQ